MVQKVFSGAVDGIKAVVVEVEADVANGLPATNIVGLPDTAVKESRERVRSAIKNSGGSYPQTRVSVNLAPADVPKNGSHFDLPIALSILLAAGAFELGTKEKLFVGELALDGTLRAVPGVLAITREAKRLGFKEIFLPEDNANEALSVGGIRVFAFKTLAETVSHLTGIEVREVKVLSSRKVKNFKPSIDFKDVSGQALAKRALKIAAAGGHNVLFTGPPGSGKTMLAKAMVGILPELTQEEVLEVSTIYSVAGLLRGGLVENRPFRNPHHTTSNIALIGGGANARPGEITLAHKGVLFLDELPEFQRHVLETLRQPLEDGKVTVSRAKTTHTYPAEFIFIASQNPCPCGFYGDKEKECICTPYSRLVYQKKLSGPLLDRIDLFVQVNRVPYEEFREKKVEESSSEIRKKVTRARKIQNRRLNGRTNAVLNVKELEQYCAIAGEVEALLNSASKHYNFSLRQIHRVLRVARTIADLDESDSILEHHLAEALQFRKDEVII